MDRELLERGGAPAAVQDITLRPATPRDAGLLRRVHASTRAEELAQVAWGPGQQEQFLMMQFDLQDAGFRRAFPDATYDVVEVAAVPVGRLYVDRTEECLRIIDIALLPEARGAGVGARLIEQVQQEAGASARAVSLHVARRNRAGNLYRRLGFEIVSEDDVYQLLEWRPS